MACVEFVTLLILGLHPAWRDDACDRTFSSEENFVYCDREREEGKAWAEEVAHAICDETERQDVPRDWTVGQIERESSFTQGGDPCPFSITADRIVSREVLDADSNRERICWKRQIHGHEGQNCQPVIVLSEEDGTLEIDRCAYGEVGLMQIRDHEFRAGTVIPSTGVALPSSRRERRTLAADPAINVSLGVAAISRVRDECCMDARDVEECHADPARYLGAYNCGSCRGATAENYVRNVDRVRLAALAYACEKMPDEPECVAAGLGRQEGDGGEGGGPEPLGGEGGADDPGPDEQRDGE